MAWKMISEFPNYEIDSNTGNVRVIKTKQIRKTRLTHDGYVRVTLFPGAKARTIHRLQALTFLDNPDNLKTVNHINGDKTDNRIENLEWLSVKNNIDHAIRNGLRDIVNKSMRDRQISSRKEVLCIETGEIFESAREASRQLSLKKVAVSNAANPNSKTKKAGGYHWQYIDG